MFSATKRIKRVYNFICYKGEKKYDTGKTNPKERKKKKGKYKIR